MEPKSPSQTDKANQERLVKELETMRDAATRLSLAISDFRFHVVSQGTKELSKKAATVLDKYKQTKP